MILLYSHVNVPADELREWGTEMNKQEGMHRRVKQSQWFGGWETDELEGRYRGRDYYAPSMVDPQNGGWAEHTKLADSGR